MSDNIEISMLYDFYGPLLNESQRKAVEFCINDDLSLAEAAELLDISRQGVRDSLNRATENLYSYEEKLGLYKLYLESVNQCQFLADKINNLVSQLDDEKLKKEANEIKDIATHIINGGQDGI